MTTSYRHACAFKRFSHTKIEDPRSLLLRVNDRNIVVTPSRSGKGNDGQPSGWEIIRTVDIPVELHSGTNTVTISGNTPWAPDIDRVIVR